MRFFLRLFLQLVIVAIACFIFLNIHPNAHAGWICDAHYWRGDGEGSVSCGPFDSAEGAVSSDNCDSRLCEYYATPTITSLPVVTSANVTSVAVSGICESDPLEIKVNGGIYTTTTCNNPPPCCDRTDGSSWTAYINMSGYADGTISVTATQIRPGWPDYYTSRSYTAYTTKTSAPPPPTDTTAPTIDTLSVSSSWWLPNGSNSYNINLYSTETGSGFGGDYGVETGINMAGQGSNSGNSRGLFGWYPSGYIPAWGGNHENDVACSGGGNATKYNGGWGYQYIDLISCNVSISTSAQSRITLTVRPRTNFGEWAQINDVSMYVQDAAQNGRGWTVFDTNFGSDGTAPSLDSVSVNSSWWVPNGSNTYTINAASTESGSGIGGLYGIMALINYQGSNAGNYRGAFAWNPTGAPPGWSGSYTQMTTCTGNAGGHASKYTANYGPQYTDLTGCNATKSGNQTVVTFTVRPTTSFGEWAQINDISEYASDIAGNVNGWNNFDSNFGSDTSSPSIFWTAQQPDTWFSGDPAISVSFSDSLSGFYCFNWGWDSNPGNTCLLYANGGTTYHSSYGGLSGGRWLFVNVQDQAGNWSSTQRIFYRDYTPPSVTFANGQAPNSWYSPNNTIRMDYSDGESGIGSGCYNWAWDVLPAQSCAYSGSYGTTTHPGTGERTLFVRTRDAVSNWIDSSATFKRDYTAPTISWGIQASGVWYSTNNSISVSFGDTESGFNCFNWWWDYSGSNDCGFYSNGSSTTIPDCNIHTLYVRVRDNAGNWAGPFAQTYYRDCSGPTISDITSSGNAVKGSTVTFYVYASDSQSGLNTGNAAFYLGTYPYSSWNRVNGATMNWDGSRYYYSVTLNDNYNQQYRAFAYVYDGLGNQNSRDENATEFTIANTAPPISTPSTVTCSGNSGGNGATIYCYNGNITFTTNAVTDTDGQTVQYYFKVTTGSDAETGAVCNSGWQTATTYSCNPGLGLFYWHVHTYDGVNQTNANYVWSFYNYAKPVIGTITKSCTGTTSRNNVAWTAGSGVSTYAVFRDGSSIVSGLSSATTSYNDDASTVGSSHTYFVRATYPSTATGDSATSTTVTTYKCVFTISGRVYNDPNGNGAQDTGEANLSGASLTLSPGSVPATSNGNAYPSTNYSFSSLGPGVYSVTVTALSGYTLTTTNPVAVTFNADDPDATNTSFGMHITYTAPTLSSVTSSCAGAAPANTVTWTAGTGATSYNVLRSTTTPASTVIATSVTSPYSGDTPTINTLYYYAVRGVYPDGSTRDSASSSVTTCSYTISGTVYNDPIGNSTGTVGLQGATITLSGAGTGTRTTDTNGVYSFTLLAAGTYTVTVTFAGYTITPPASLTNPIGPSWQNVNFYMHVTYTAPTLGTVTSSCAGAAPANTVTWTAGTGATSYSIFRNPPNSSIGTTSSTSYTDNTPVANTSYTYFVRGVYPDSVNRDSAISSSVTTCSYTISGTVYNDPIGNSTGTVGLQGATITLSGAGTGTQTTDTNGVYSFTLLAAGTYTVTASFAGYTITPPTSRINTIGPSWQNVNFYMHVTYTAPTLGTVTSSCAGAAPANTVTWTAGTGATSYNIIRTKTSDSTTVTYTNVTSPYTDNTPVANTSYTYFVRGVYPDSVNRDSATSSSVTTCSYTISGTVYNDPIGNSTGTVGLQGATLTLSGAGAGTQTTDTNGAYSFTLLAAGTYTVTASFAGYTITPPAFRSNIILGPSWPNVNFYMHVAYTAPTLTPTPTSLVPNTCSGLTSVNTITWTAGTGATSYNILRTRTDISGSITFTNVTSPYTDNNATPNNLEVGGTYTYQVQGVYPDGTTHNSASVSTDNPVTTPSTIIQRCGFTISGVVYDDSSGATPNAVKDTGEPYLGGATVTLSGPVNYTTTTDTSTGAFSWPVPAGNYTLTATKTNYIDTTSPCGYATYTPSCSIPINASGSTDPANNLVGLRRVFSAQGNVFIDTNKNNHCENATCGGSGSSESVYSSPVTITATATGGNEITPASPSNGTYTLNNLFTNNTYAISYPNPPSGYQFTVPSNGTYYVTFTLPPSPPGPTDTISSGISTGIDAAPDANNNIANLNIGISNSIPWGQCYNGDCREEAAANLTNQSIPSNVVSTERYVSKRTGSLSNTAGIVFSGNSTLSSTASAAPSGWKVDGLGGYIDKFTPSTPNVLRASYNAYNAALKQNGISATDLSTYCTVLNCNLSSTTIPSGVYNVSGNLAITAAFTLSGNKNVVILVPGNLTISASILVQNGSTLTFSVGGDITVSSSVGQSLNSTVCAPSTGFGATSTGCDIEGYYIAGGNFVINSLATDASQIDGYNCSQSQKDKRLNIAGTVIVNANLSSTSGGQLTNHRDMCNDNLSYPVYTFTERPDFILNAPEFIKKPSVVWQEIAP